MRLNAAISVNLKPNEDGEYAEVQKQHFSLLFCCVVLPLAACRVNVQVPFMPLSPMEALTSGQYYTVPALVCTKLFSFFLLFVLTGTLV